MTVEKAFILNETIEAIKKLVKLKQSNTEWLDKFLPKNRERILVSMSENVNQLGYAGFPIEASEVSLNTIELIIHHDNIFKSSEILKDHEKEIERVEKMIDELEKWHNRLVLHSKTEVEDVQDPGYCEYAHVQFYG